MENSHAPARTDRPYVAQIRALRHIFRDSLVIYTRGTQNGPRDQKGGITPVLFCCNKMQDAHGNQSHLNLLPDRKREKGCHEKYRPTHRIKTAPTEITKPGHYASDPQGCPVAPNISAQPFSTTNTKERDALDLVVERHQLGASENDIRAAFQRFLETAEIATLAEQTTEGPPGIGNPGRMGLYVHNTCIEFKTNIVRNGIPIPSDVGHWTSTRSRGRII